MTKTRKRFEKSAIKVVKKYRSYPKPDNRQRRVLQCCISQAMRSASVKKLFYYYGVYTGCCVGFNTVFSKLKCALVV